MILAMVVDGLILARVLIAKLRKETNRDWVIYLAMGASSLFLIPLVIAD